MTVFAAGLAIASISEATFMRMGAMPVEPKIDNVIKMAFRVANATARRPRFDDVRLDKISK